MPADILMDHFYTRTAVAYDLLVRNLPLWRSWLNHALPHIKGPRVLEVSFGTGYLMTQYAGHFQTWGIDYNRRMIEISRKNLDREGVTAVLQRADVEALPYPDGAFDTVVNTMAFSGYQNGSQALSELARVIKPGGRLVMIDVNYPLSGSRLGRGLARMWQTAGDTLRDMEPLFNSAGFDFTDQEIGGFGSVHLYVAEK